MHNPVVSYYSRVTSPGSQLVISILDWLTGIKEGRWAYPVSRVRTLYQQEGKTDRYRSAKLTLPATTPAARFDYKCNDRMAQASGILHADVDKLAEHEMPAVIAALRADPLTFYLFVSPSGHGIKFAFRIPPVENDTAYKGYFYALERDLKDRYDLIVDAACKDLSRGCYVSVDPGLYVNPDSDLFLETAGPPVTEPKPAPFRTPSAGGWQGSGANDPVSVATRMLETAAAHTKNHTRIRAGRLIGGYIAAGLLSPSVADELAEVAATYSDDPQRARRDFYYGIRYGQASPIEAQRRMSISFAGFKSRFSRRGMARG